MRLFSKIFCLFFVFAGPLFATETGLEEMNGIRLKTYEGFESKWTMATVRYRADSGEMRFVYGNPLAIQALKAGSKDYPDGAVFAKIGLGTADDPAFTSSKVPSGAKRFQFMVRDKKKYAATGGWGYALFDLNGRTFLGTPLPEATKACYACHQIVPERGQVFSQMANLSSFPGAALHAAAADFGARVKFRDEKVSDLPAWIRAYFRTGVKTVRLLEGPMTKTVFQGTVDEIRPALLREARQKNAPALFMSDDQKQMALYVPRRLCRLKSLAKCSKGQEVKYMGFWTIGALQPNGRRVVDRGGQCE